MKKQGKLVLMTCLFNMFFVNNVPNPEPVYGVFYVKQAGPCFTMQLDI